MKILLVSSATRIPNSHMWIHDTILESVHARNTHEGRLVFPPSSLQSSLLGSHSHTKYHRGRSESRVKHSMSRNVKRDVRDHLSLVKQDVRDHLGLAWVLLSSF